VSFFGQKEVNLDQKVKSICDRWFEFYIRKSGKILWCDHYPQKGLIGCGSSSREIFGSKGRTNKKREFRFMFYLNLSLKSLWKITM